MGHTIFIFIMLSLLASVVVGLVAGGRKVLGILNTQAEVQRLEAQSKVNRLRHQLEIDGHQHNLQVLALTAEAGPDGAGHDRPETVNGKVEPPPEYDSYGDLVTHSRMQRDATTAEWHE